MTSGQRRFVGADGEWPVRATVHPTSRLSDYQGLVGEQVVDSTGGREFTQESGSESGSDPGYDRFNMAATFWQRMSGPSTLLRKASATSAPLGISLTPDRRTTRTSECWDLT